jgi:phage gp36-like protein
MYATRQQIIDRYGAAALIVAADRDGDGAEDTGVVEQALTDASELMDSYIGAKYPLPLASAAPVLIPVCVDIAFYKLCQGHGPLTDEIKDRFEQAIAWLRDLSKGVVSLGSPAVEGEPAPGERPEFTSAPRRFTRDSLKGM